MNQQIQSIVVSLSDGTQGVFTGPALVSPDDERTITNIQFSEPAPLPDGCSIGVLDESLKKDN